MGRTLTGGADGERIARLAREAAQGYSRPRGTPTASCQEQEDDILRGFLSRILEINRRVIEQNHQVDKEALAALYTARSFSSPEAMGRATRAVRELLQVNRRVAKDMQRALRDVKGQIESAKLSSLEKALFWREVAEGFATKFQPRSEILEMQQMWAETTTETYEFALCHSDQLRFEGKTVRASSGEVGREFIEKLKRAKHCRDEFRAAAARVHQKEAAVLSELGVAKPPVP
ncbi:MAG TPA: hypothetical protein VNJ52_04690 [Patescibacteria group bacterium]|nr:hypothetical protein [Patescibacteria group bacterium]